MKKSNAPTITPEGDAIVFVSKPAIRPMLKQGLKDLYVANVHTPDSTDACIEALVLSHQAILIVDWELGLETLTQVLKAAQGSVGVDTRSIFLVTLSMGRDVVAVAAEYGIARVHSGELTMGDIKQHLETIILDEQKDLPMRLGLARIADARQRGDWQLAGSYLIELQSQFPTNRRINCELVENLIHLDRWEHASAIVETLAMTDSDNLRVQHFRARILMRSGKYDEATTLLESCQLVNPHNVDRLVDLGKALLQVGRFQDAHKSFDQAVKLDKTNADAREGQMQCRLLTGDVNDALRLMRELSGPRELASLFNAAAILAIKQGRFPQGLSLYETAISSLTKEDAIAARLVFNLGLAYHKWGRGDDAINSFRRAADLDPSFAPAQHNLRIVSQRLGRGPVKPRGTPKEIDPVDDLLGEILEEKIG